MGSRVELNTELKTFIPNVYFQPPSNIQMVYPCIVYSKTEASKTHANNRIYRRVQGYKLTLIENHPDSGIAESIEDHFQYCEVDQHYVVDNLNHTTINLYY